MKKVKFTKKEQELISQLEIGKEAEEIKNPYSLRSCLCQPLEVALHDFIKGCEITGNYDYFDIARYLFLKLNPEAYYTLLD